MKNKKKEKQEEKDMKKKTSGTPPVLPSENINTSEPLVKDFVDDNEKIIKHLKLVLPHHPKSTVHPKFLYKNKQGHSKYRVNYLIEDQGVFVSTSKISHSKMVEVKIKENKIHVEEITKYSELISLKNKFTK
jgi:hypothetical protein